MSGSDFGYDGDEFAEYNLQLDWAEWVYFFIAYVAIQQCISLPEWSV
jgi:hypothetical protein